MLNTFNQRNCLVYMVNYTRKVKEMTIEQMKSAIHEIYPKWNLEDKSDGQIVAIYFRIKERRTKK